MRLLPVFSPGERVLAAVSGGPDSVALLYLLAGEMRAGRLALSCAHMNHRIRGAEADRDEQFVAALCARLGVPFFAAREDVPALSKARGQGLETCAREIRREFLLRAMAERGLSVVATAHHADDQAETVLMHLMRGGGLRGAGGMRAREGAFARPLLGATRAEILAFLEKEGLDYCLDSTNDLLDTPRNAVRHLLLPEAEKIYPGARAALSRFAGLAQEADDFLCREARAFLGMHALLHPFGASVRADTGAHIAVRRQGLRILTGLDSAGIERLISLDKPREFGSLRAEKTGGRLFLIDRRAGPPEIHAPVRDGAHIPGFGRLTLRPSDPVPIRDDPYRQVVEASALAGAVLRLRRPGDVMRPLGAPGDRRLSDVMIDKKMPRPMRDWQVIVARDNRVLWIPGLLIAQEAALQENTRAAVALTWVREDIVKWMDK